jgi:hypothetical protein
MVVDQTEPVEPIIQARLPRTVQRPRGILRHGVQIAEQSDVNRHPLCPFRAALS